MTTNGVMLILSLALLLLQQLIQAQHTTMLHGLAYAMSSRDKPVDVGALGGRLQRAKVNLIENLMLFAPVSILGELMQVNHHMVNLGAIIFFVARVIYVPLYWAGVPGLRTLAWLASVIGIVIVAIADLGWV